MIFDSRLFKSLFLASFLIVSLLFAGYFLSVFNRCDQYCSYIQSLAPEIGAAGVGGIVIGSVISITVDQYESYRQWLRQRTRLDRRKRSNSILRIQDELSYNSKNADFSGFSITSEESIQSVSMVGCKFSVDAGVLLYELSFEDCTIIGSQFGSSGKINEIRDVNFSGSDLISCVFSNLQIGGNLGINHYNRTLFRRCRFIGVKFVGQNFESAEIDQCVFWRSSFDGVRVPGELLHIFEQRGWATRGAIAGTWSVYSLSAILLSRNSTHRMLALWMTFRTFGWSGACILLLSMSVGYWVTQLFTAH